MKIHLITLARAFLSVLYALMKMRRQRKQIVMLSRESDTEPIDFRLLREELERVLPEYRTVTLCEQLSSSHVSPLKIARNTLKSMWLLSVSEICILDTYSLPVSILRQRDNLCVVQLWHALGGLKLSGYGALDRPGGHSAAVARALKMHRNYTFVTAASEYARELYSLAFDCPKEKILKLGMPRIDYILENTPEKEAVRKALSERHRELCNGKKTILYAPTFRAKGGIYLQEMLDNIDFSRYNLAVKAHCLETEVPERQGVVYLTESLLDLFSLADYIVTDYSAASAEASLTGKPLFFYGYDLEEYLEERGLFLNPLSEYPTISFSHFGDIYRIIEDGTYDETARCRFRDKMVETLDTGNTGRIAEKIREKRNIE